MALWFPIMVNYREVGRVELVRIAPVDHTPAQDEDCTYTLKYYERDKPTPTFESKVHYPYQALNPIPLLTTALEKISNG